MFGVEFALWPVFSASSPEVLETALAGSTGEDRPRVYIAGTDQPGSGADLACFAIQSYNEGFGGDVDFTLGGFPLDSTPGNERLRVLLNHVSGYENVVVLDEPTSEQEYLSRYTGADVVIFPYRSNSFYGRTASTLLDGLYSNAQLIVAEGTWLSDEARLFDGTHTFADGDDVALARTIRAVSRKRLSRNQQKRRRHLWQQRYSPGRLIGRIEGIEEYGDGLSTDSGDAEIEREAPCTFEKPVYRSGHAALSGADLRRVPLNMREDLLDLREDVGGLGAELEERVSANLVPRVESLREGTETLGAAIDAMSKQADHLRADLLNKQQEFETGTSQLLDGLRVDVGQRLEDQLGQVSKQMQSSLEAVGRTMETMEHRLAAFDARIATLEDTLVVNFRELSTLPEQGVTTQAGLARLQHATEGHRATFTEKQSLLEKNLHELLEAQRSTAKSGLELERWLRDELLAKLTSVIDAQVSSVRPVLSSDEFAAVAEALKTRVEAMEETLASVSTWQLWQDELAAARSRIVIASDELESGSSALMEAAASEHPRLQLAASVERLDETMTAFARHLKDARRNSEEDSTLAVFTGVLEKLQAIVEHQTRLVVSAQDKHDRAERMAELEARLSERIETAFTATDGVAERLGVLEEKDQDQELRAPSNRDLYQRFSRTLSFSDLNLLFESWVPRLGLDMKKPNLAYDAELICELEKRCEGRLASSVQDALLRSLVVRAAPGKHLRYLEIGTLFGVNLVVMHELAKHEFSALKLVSIDPLELYYDQSRDVLTGLPIQLDTVRSNMKRAGVPPKRIEFIQELSTSEAALLALGTTQFNCMLIDGDHTWDGIQNDHVRYLPRLSPERFSLWTTIRPRNGPT